MLVVSVMKTVALIGLVYLVSFLLPFAFGKKKLKLVAPIVGVIGIVFQLVVNTETRALDKWALSFLPQPFISKAYWSLVAFCLRFWRQALQPEDFVSRGEWIGSDMPNLVSSCCFCWYRTL